MAKKKAPKMTPVAVALLAAVAAAVEEGLLTNDQLVAELGLESAEAEEKPAKGKGKKAAKEEAPAKGKAAKGKGKKVVEDEDDEDDEDEDSDDDAPDFGEMSLKQMKAFVKENELEVPKAVLKDEDELREWLEENYAGDDEDSDDDEDDEDDSDDDEDEDDEDDSDDDEDDEDW